jgi:serine/threonine protein kinase
VRAGSYRLIELLGAGGIGAVWLGEHPVIGSRVAVKILHPEMCENDEAVRRFVVEAQAVNRVQSPHIVKTFDFGKLADGRDYAVMELLEGVTLEQHIQQSGALAVAQLLDIATQLTRALIVAHEAGIVHRDLKPENTHLGGDPRTPHVRVLDFGIAKLLSEKTAEVHKTQLGIALGTPLGTPLYAAPEQLVGHEIDSAADIYAFGLTARSAHRPAMCWRGSRPSRLRPTTRIAFHRLGSSISPRWTTTPCATVGRFGLLARSSCCSRVQSPCGP